MNNPLDVSADLARKQAAAEAFASKFAYYSQARLPVAMLYPSATNPRRRLTGLDELTASIAKVGLLQPLVVRRLVDSEDKFEVVSGHRRLAAAQKLNMVEVPVVIIEATDAQVLEAQLVENLQRVDLSPMEEAEGVAALRDVSGYTPEQLAQKTGKSRGWVYQRLKLLDLCSEARKALASGALSVSVAIPLARLPTPKLQVKALERVAGEPPMGAREAIEYLQREFCITLRGAPFDRKDDMLVEGAPACVKCPKRSGSGPTGLFDDLELDVCTDVVCYQEKARATWDAKAEKAAKQGAEVLTPAEGRRLFRDGVLQYGTGYVELDTPVHEDSKRRAWAEVLEKATVQVVVAPDAELRPHRLYREAEARAAAAELGLKWATPRIASPKAETSSTPAPTPAGPTEEHLREVRARVAADVLAGAAIKMLSMASPPRALYVLMARATEATRAPGPAVARYLEQQRVKDTSKWLLKADEKELLGFCFVALAEEWCGGTWQGFDEGLEVLAKAFGFNLSAMVQDATAANTE